MTETWTLHELEPNGAGESRWSAGVNGPRVYLTCDRETAERILRAVNSHAQLVEACLLLLVDAEDFKAHIGSAHANRLRAALAAAKADNG